MSRIFSDGGRIQQPIRSADDVDSRIMKTHEFNLNVPAQQWEPLNLHLSRRNRDKRLRTERRVIPDCQILHPKTEFRERALSGHPEHPPVDEGPAPELGDTDPGTDSNPTKPEGTG